jgi:hypothetical protein
MNMSWNVKKAIALQLSVNQAIALIAKILVSDRDYDRFARSQSSG